MFKILTMVIPIAIFASALFPVGCSPNDPLQEDVAVKPEFIDALPDELFHWLSHELALDRGARVFSNSHEGYTYYVASAGNQSVVNGKQL